MTEQELAQNCYDDSGIMAKRLSELGRQIVFAIIAGAWTLSYSHSEFCPSKFLIWSIALAFLYLFFDLLYYLFSYLIYHGYYVFNKDDVTFDLVDTKKDTIRSQAKWDKVGGYWIFGKTLILLASAALIIIHVFSI